VDSQGLAVPGATVTVTGPQGTRSVVTDSTGRFQVPFLNPGEYAVRGELQGFKAVEQKDVTVRLGQSTDLPLKMEVGGLTETVQVTGAAPNVDTQTTTNGTFVNLVEHGTGVALGWTSNVNLGDVQYERAKANFVYMAQIKPRADYKYDKLPVMVYLPPNFDGKKADVLIYFHGDAADYAAGKANNYDRENPAIGMDLAGVAGGASRIIIAPQVNEGATGSGTMLSPWNLLHAGDYESIVQTVFKNLQSDLKLANTISRGSFSLAGHSGGGKPLGQAAEDLEPTGGGVTDITLVDAGYGVWNMKVAARHLGCHEIDVGHDSSRRTAGGAERREIGEE